MTNPIRTYEDLLKHRNDLDLLLKAQKELVVADLKLLQADFKAPRETISMVTKMVSAKKNNPILTIGLNQVIDVLLKKVLLRRAGWVARTALTLVAKNYTSHYVQSHKKQFVNKLFSWIGHRKSNGKAAPGAFGKVK